MTYLIANGHRVRTRRPRRASTLYRWDTKIAVTGVTRNLIHNMYLMYLMYLEPVRQQGEVRTRPTEGVCRSFDHEAHHRVGAADSRSGGRSARSQQGSRAAVDSLCHLGGPAR